MLAFAKAQIGKPFSNTGMARSLLFPRQSSYSSFYCAELVAAILKQGGLISTDSNPGAATPYSLYKLYSKQAAATANPYALRQMNSGLTLNTLGGGGFPSKSQENSAANVHAQNLGSFLYTGIVPELPLNTGGSARRRVDSPPRASFKVLAAGQQTSTAPGLTLSLTSLR